MVYSGSKGLIREDTLDEYFEYEAEEFLVNLALLITEGRTPEYSIKGRTEGFHCPPAQSSQPTTTKHECSDRLAQCCQARHTRSEVTLLWKKNIPIMIEVMLLPDCCYSDEGPTTEGNDLNDPAIKQDALLLERWILEPVPRQSGDRFIEEKTLLLAVRSFVFFSQLSAWLSVSHGAVPRNILCRVSAAHVDLQWTFSQTPTEHLFPVPNISHNVALKVSVQSLPRQSNYPVLTCSIHANFGFYGSRREETNVHQRCDSVKTEQPSVANSQRPCGKLMWAESVLGVKQGPEFNTAVRNLKLYPLAGLGSDFGSLESKVQGYPAAVESRALLPEMPERVLKSSGLADTRGQNSNPSRQSLGDSIPLIGSLLQERHEVIARIAQHLIHCDPATSPVTRKAFSTSETGVANPKGLHHALEEKSLLKKGRELPSVAANLEHNASENVGKVQLIPETPLSRSYVPLNQCFRQMREETNPLISSLLHERQEVITRIAQHLIHCDPPRSQGAPPVFTFHDVSAVNPKAFHTSCEEGSLLKKSKDVPSDSFSNSRLALPADDPKTKLNTPITPLHSLRCDADHNVSPSFRRKLLLAETNEVVQNTFHQSPSSRSQSPLTCTTQSCNKEGYKSELTEKLESVLSGCPHKPQVAKRGTAKPCSHFRCNNELVCRSKFKDRTISCENSDPHFSNNPQVDQHRILENVKATTVLASDCWHKYESRHLNKDSKQLNVSEQNSQLTSIENYLHKDHDVFKCKSKQDRVKNANDENEEPTDYEVQKHCQKKPVEDSLAAFFEQRKNAEVLKTIPLKHVWRKSNFHHLDGTSAKAFHPRTGLPLLSSPVPERKTQTGCFDLDASLLRLKCLSSKSPQRYISKENDSDIDEKALLSSSTPSVTSLSLLGNFEESVLNYRLDPLGIVGGFTAEVGASGLFCPTHMTLPVEVSFYSVSEDNAPSPYMGVIALESLGKRGYRVPPSGTIQVTLFNPNKTVVKMFVVIYDLREMPANHQTFLRQRTFSVPVKRETRKSIIQQNTRHTEERLLRYLIHLRFQSSKSGKIYLYRDVRLLFSRKSMEVDSGAAYELKSYTESPMNPQFSPRC
ncbi:atos homolog protein A isoform X2 [Ahaetulla prasina]|uniref:atos homolog protein A isoform X2 n=1 Tax=Ahaetulla prasina TaxID=499056 RepID=UPI0026483996|nr:atos homolog protein A isoform X2 [Ahaetulla prasina]XP_058012057.1 atos homolog protein A isoform X2 [Ahaetulla prasina]